MHNITLKKIVLYPIKACGGIEVSEAQVEERGLQYDRRWMVVDAEGIFIDQLRQPRLASIKPEISGASLILHALGMEPLEVPLRLERPALVSAKVMNALCEVALVGAQADAWLSRFLGVPCQLVFMPDSTRRPVNPKYAINSAIVSFASGYPFHILSEASWEYLNQRLDKAVPLNRFRPNLVIGGVSAFTEDHWRLIRIGSLPIHVVKPCDRCAITTVDQASGEVMGQEPLRQLALFRTVDRKVLFGQYAVPGETGVLKVGDVVAVLQEKELVKS